MNRLFQIKFTIVSFGVKSKHRMAYPVSIALGIVFLLAFIFLIAIYVKRRKMNRSLKGFRIDVLTSRHIELKGIKIRPNIRIGDAIGVEYLVRDGYKAIFIGTGVWRPNALHIKRDFW